MARKAKLLEAVAYLRTSSAANVGPDKDSDKRQRAAIGAFAKRGGYELVAEFNDAAVSGADPIETRRGFAELLDRIEGNGVRTVIVEDASRFARELMTQELGILALIRRGVRVLTANGDDLTDGSDPSRKMMRQIAGAFHEYEKARLVAKLRAARERRRASVIGSIPIAPTIFSRIFWVLAIAEPTYSATTSRTKREEDASVGFEATNPRAVAGSRIDNDKWPLRRVHLDALGRHDLDQTVVHRPVKFTAVDDDFYLVVENMRNGLGGMLLIGVATLPHGVPEQRRALRRIDHVFGHGAKPVHRSKRQGVARLFVFATVCHLHLQRSTVLLH